MGWFKKKITPQTLELNVWEGRECDKIPSKTNPNALPKKN